MRSPDEPDANPTLDHPMGRRRSTLDPTLDIVFKMLFAAPSESDALRSLLTAVLRPASPIVEVTVLNPDVSRAQVKDKGIVLDIRVRLANGRQSNIEMQAEKRPAFRERAVYYWSRLYGGQLERGQPYTSLKPVISVLFLDHRELDGTELHSTFRILNTRDHTPLTDALEIHLIELPKRLAASEATRQAEPALLAWCRFLGATTDEEVQEACVDHPEIEKAQRRLEQLSASPEARDLAEQRELALDTYRIEMTAARQEGEAAGHRRGHQEGHREGQAELLLDLLRMKFGAIDDAVADRVRAAPEASISRWSKNVLEATSVREVLSD